MFCSAFEPVFDFACRYAGPALASVHRRGKGAGARTNSSGMSAAARGTPSDGLQGGIHDPPRPHRPLPATSTPPGPPAATHSANCRRVPLSRHGPPPSKRDEQGHLRPLTDMQAAYRCQYTDSRRACSRSGPRSGCRDDSLQWAQDPTLSPSAAAASAAGGSSGWHGIRPAGRLLFASSQPQPPSPAMQAA